MSTAWFHCFSGVAGDMTLGALLDAGADLADVRALLGRLPVTGWSLEAEATMRNGIAATRAVVTTAENHHHRTVADIEALLDAATLPERVDARARAVLGRLGAVEGAIHGLDPKMVELHEVGALDAIVDIVGTCAALEVLDIDEIRCSPIATGLGTVRGAHGVLPNPSPAVVALLAGVPAHGLPIAMELATPTGVALMVALATSFGPLPAMTSTGVGYGAGSRELDGRPNVVQVVLGTPMPPGPPVGLAMPGQAAVLLEANVDDVTGEVLAHVVASLMATGAHDAWVTPIIMKKGRPAHTVSVLCDPSLVASVGAVLVAESGTLGLRGRTVERWPQPREQRAVTVDGHLIGVKVAAQRIKVEHDDAVAAARALGRPLRTVLAEAEAQAEAQAKLEKPD